MQRKRIQNHVAESRLTLPAAVAYATAVWFLFGLVRLQLWPQFACFVATTYLMAVLNNNNALIRIFSRLDACSFAVLTCTACFLFPSMQGAILTLCYVVFYLLLFRTYQDKLSMGWTYYAFLCIGLSSLAYVHVLFLIPVFWLFMLFQLTSFSWRTMGASVLGVITPYWLLLPLAVYKHQIGQYVTHFSQLSVVQPIADYSQLSVNQILLWGFVTLLAFTGIIHFWRNSSGDRIRIRQLYSIFTAMVFVVSLLFALQPQHYDVLLRLLIINTAPLIAHFLALTYTRYTNYAFYAICAAVLLLTMLNLWMPSLLS